MVSWAASALITRRLVTASLPTSRPLSVRARPKIKDSAEIYIGDEFIGTLTREDEDGELCYQFQMAILEMDLEDA